MKKTCRFVPVLVVASVAFVTTGCASHLTIEQEEISIGDKPVSRPENPTMPEALQYSMGLKEGVLKNAGYQFNIGQAMNGALIGAATAATALLAFEGNQTAAAGVGLGAGVLGITDRFLLIDESIGVYKNAVDALTCGENLLAPLGFNAASTSPAAKQLESLMGASGMRTLQKEVETLSGADVGSSAIDIAIFTPVIAQLQVAANAEESLNEALAAAADQDALVPAKADSRKLAVEETAAQRLVRLVDQVRLSVNTTLLQKKMTVEEIVAAFDKTVGDYVKKIDERRKKAEEEKKKADAVKNAAILMVATMRTQDVSLGTVQNLSEVGNVLLLLEEGTDPKTKNLPTTEQVNQCMLLIAGAKPPAPKETK